VLPTGDAWEDEPKIKHIPAQWGQEKRSDPRSKIQDLGWGLLTELRIETRQTKETFPFFIA
jgi:hypothetical protein